MSSPIFAAYYIPGLNVAFLFSLFLTLAMTAGAIWYGTKRPVGKPLTWAEAMIGSVYVFTVFFLAYGVVPHQWLTHADNELNWRPDKLLTGPTIGDKGIVEYLPFEITYQVVRDIVVVGIYAVLFGANLYLWSWWQKRGKKKPATAELTASTYGRPLVRKG